MLITAKKKGCKVAKAQTKTFEEENSRKDKLFEAWEHYLNQFFGTMPDQIEFDDIYEGMCTVTGLNENTISLELDDGRKLLHISVSQQVAQNSLFDDLVFMTLGRKDGKWYTLKVFSIGSLFGKLSNEIHMSINPTLMAEFSGQDDFTKAVNS